MNASLFDFWADVPADARIHPADVPVFERLRDQDGPGHDFDLRCLPANIHGPVRTARVVLLYLSPGLANLDLIEADTLAAQQRYARRRTGLMPLTGPDEHEPAWKWWTGKTRLFGPWQDLRERVGILNISPYHSKDFKGFHLLGALPSCRATIDWAQSVLFPQAEAGERVVVCLRSARYWGLGGGGRYGKSLFVPVFSRSGHMLRAGHELAARDDVVTAVRQALTLPPLPA